MKFRPILLLLLLRYIAVLWVPTAVWHSWIPYPLIAPETPRLDDEK
jgi:hypothetical protein